MRLYYYKLPRQNLHVWLFLYFIPYKFYDLFYFIIAHARIFFLYQPIYYQKWIENTVCQTDLIMTLNCLNMSKWVFSLIWHIHHKVDKSLFFKHIRRPNENTAEIWHFTPTSISPDFHQCSFHLFSKVFNDIIWTT